MTDNKGHIEEEIWFSAISEDELAKYDKEAAFAAFRQRVNESRKDHKVSDTLCFPPKSRTIITV